MAKEGDFRKILVAAAAEMGIDMPITQAVNAVLYQDMPALDAVEQLLSRDPKIESL